MKKLSTILLAFIMTACLAACGESGSVNSSGTSPQSSVSATSEAQTEETTVEETTVEKATVEEATTSAELQAGDSGKGEKTLDSGFCTVTIPEGLEYKIYYYSCDEDALGTIQIDFGKTSTTEGRLEVSTTRIISSLDDAAEECVRVRNLDSYKDGKYEIGNEKTFGDTTYKEVTMSHEYGGENCLVSHYKRADGKDIYVEIRTKQNDFDKLQLDDPLVEELINSVVYK